MKDFYEYQKSKILQIIFLFSIFSFKTEKSEKKNYYYDHLKLDSGKQKKKILNTLFN